MNIIKISKEIKKGVKVKVLSGKDSGKNGVVMSVFRDNSTVKIAGINLVKKHLKPNHNNSGGIVLKEMPIHISNISVQV